MTYTTAYKDYPAATFEEAAAAMLRDPEVWQYTLTVPVESDPVETGGQKGYSAESWDWNGIRLRVNFR